MSKGTALAETSKASTALAVTPEMAAMFAEDAGTGFENVKKGDFALPFIKILQGLSPEIQRGNPKFIQGAQQGDIVHSLTGEVINGEEGILVVAAAYDKKFIEWRPRKSGGGLVGIRDTKREAERLKLADVGNPDVDTTIDETAQHYVLAAFSGGYAPALLSFSRTKLKASRAWIGLQMQQTTTKFGIPGPTKVLNPAAVVYRLTTASETKNGNTYYVPVFTAVSLNQDQGLYLAAREFSETVSAGDVNVNYEEAVKEEVRTTDSGSDSEEPQY